MGVCSQHTTVSAHNKFWAISRREDVLTIRFGKIGTAGQTKVHAPDGSWIEAVRHSNELVKAKTLEELKTGVKAMFETTALVIAQEFVPTKFDWRIGVLNGEPLYACQYRMARGHWQIVKHGPDGKTTEGGFKTVAVEDAPPAIVDAAVRWEGRTSS